MHKVIVGSILMAIIGILLLIWGDVKVERRDKKVDKSVIMVGGIRFQHIEVEGHDYIIGYDCVGGYMAHNPECEKCKRNREGEGRV